MLPSMARVTPSLRLVLVNMPTLAGWVARFSAVWFFPFLLFVVVGQIGAISLDEASAFLNTSKCAGDRLVSISS